MKVLVAGPTLAEAGECFRWAETGDPGLKARGYSAERRSAACSNVVKVHAITRAYCPRMGRVVFRVRPLYRFVRERLTGLSRGGRAGVRSQESGVREDPGTESVAYSVGWARLEAWLEESRMPLSRTPLAALLPACLPLLGH